MTWRDVETTQRMAVFGQAAKHDIQALGARMKAARLAAIAALRERQLESQTPPDEVDVDLTWELDPACE